MAERAIHRHAWHIGWQWSIGFGVRRFMFEAARLSGNWRLWFWLARLHVGFTYQRSYPDGQEREWKFEVKLHSPRPSEQPHA